MKRRHHIRQPRPFYPPARLKLSLSAIHPTITQWYTEYWLTQGLLHARKHETATSTARGQSTTEHYIVSKEYKHAQKKPSTSRKKDASVCKARIKKLRHSILQSMCVLLPLSLFHPSQNRATSSKERSYTRASPH